MTTILTVDDDPEVLGTIFRALEREGFAVDQAQSAQEALDYLDGNRPDMIVLDIMMPGMDGLELCRLLRSNPALNNLPILFLSARTLTDDIVAGLDAGADDYVVKPFELKELNARVRAVLRRVPGGNPATEQPTRQVGDLLLDARNYQVTNHGTSVQLTATEFRLLEHLMVYAGEVHSIDTLLEEVWNYPPGTGDPNLVRAHIRNLRRKLESDPATPQYLKTIHGVGYVVSAE